MRAIDLTIQNKIFTVTYDLIVVHNITSIMASSSGMTIMLDTVTKVYTKEENTIATNGIQKYYFELVEAQKEQINLRKQFLIKKFGELQKAQDEYNTSIQKWFHAPAHDPFKKEVE